jgi:malonyl-CoA/methylmalonyl-CoA synthetase
MSFFLRSIARRRHATATFINLRPRMLSTLPRLPLFEAVSKHDPDSKAVVHSISGRTFKYGELLGDVSRAKDRISEAAGQHDLNGERIAFLVENSYDY